MQFAAVNSHIYITWKMHLGRMLKGYMNNQTTSKVENTVEKNAYVGVGRDINMRLRICGLGSTVPGTVL